MDGAVYSTWRLAGSRDVNFQVTVLKILVSYPDGFALMADVKRDMAILATRGRDWADRPSAWRRACPIWTSSRKGWSSDRTAGGASPQRDVRSSPSWKPGLPGRRPAAILAESKCHLRAPASGLRTPWPNQSSPTSPSRPKRPYQFTDLSVEQTATPSRCEISAGRSAVGCAARRR